MELYRVMAAEVCQSIWRTKIVVIFLMKDDECIVFWLVGVFRVFMDEGEYLN